MSVFRVPLHVGDTEGSRYREVSVVVDTGSTYTTLPASLLRYLEVAPLERRPFIQADRRQVECDVSWILVRPSRRTRPTTVVIGSEEALPLIGAVTLEEFGLAVTPIAQRLMPVPGYQLLHP